MVDKLTHLKQLEAESIHIIREVAAEFDNPVMLYSIGKDSAVMLHLARKAFFPGKLPFPVMHVDTQWKFQEMYRFRDKMVAELGLDLITHVNPDGVAQGHQPVHPRQRQAHRHHENRGPETGAGQVRL
jgi:sulfate adenylyltransferase subunit 2